MKMMTTLEYSSRQPMRYLGPAKLTPKQKREALAFVRKVEEENGIYRNRKIE